MEKITLSKEHGKYFHRVLFFWELIDWYFLGALSLQERAGLNPGLHTRSFWLVIEWEQGLGVGQAGAPDHRVLCSPPRQRLLGSALGNIWAPCPLSQELRLHSILGNPPEIFTFPVSHDHDCQPTLSIWYVPPQINCIIAFIILGLGSHAVVLTVSSRFWVNSGITSVGVQGNHRWCWDSNPAQHVSDQCLNHCTISPAPFIARFLKCPLRNYRGSDSQHGYFQINI